MTWRQDLKDFTNRTGNWKHCLHVGEKKDYFSCGVYVLFIVIVVSQYPVCVPVDLWECAYLPCLSRSSTLPGQTSPAPHTDTATATNRNMWWRQTVSAVRSDTWEQQQQHQPPTSHWSPSSIASTTRLTSSSKLIIHLQWKDWRSCDLDFWIYLLRKVPSVLIIWKNVKEKKVRSSEIFFAVATNRELW